MFLVTTNSSEQDIDASIRHADMREEAKDRVEMERALSGATDAPIFEFQILNQVCVMLDPMLAYAVLGAQLFAAPEVVFAAGSKLNRFHFIYLEYA